MADKREDDVGDGGSRTQCGRSPVCRAGGQSAPSSSHSTRPIRNSVWTITQISSLLILIQNKDSNVIFELVETNGLIEWLRLLAEISSCNTRLRTTRKRLAAATAMLH